MSIAWSVLKFERRIKKMLLVSHMIWRNRISQYPKIVTDFELNFASKLGVKHAISTNNGTSGLEAAFFALGIGPGDEIISPSYTIQATFGAALTQGISVKFADIDQDTLTVSASSVESKISKKTKAIVVVHVWGNPANMEALLTLSKKHGIPIIEDCSHCHGASYNGLALGSLGDISVFSLQGGKPVAGGEGGIVVTSSDELADRVLAYCHQGRRISGTLNEPIKSEFFPYTGFGRKCRAHPLAIAMAQIDLKLLDRHNKLHNRAWTKFSDLTKKTKVFKIQRQQPKGKMGGFFLGAAATIITENLSPDQVYKILRKHNVKIDRRRHTPYHKMPHIYDIEYRKSHTKGLQIMPSEAPNLPQTEHALSHVIFFPLAQFFSAKGMRRWRSAISDLEAQNSSCL